MHFIEIITKVRIRFVIYIQANNKKENVFINDITSIYILSLILKKSWAFCFKYYDEGEVGLSLGSGFGIGGRGRSKIKTNYYNYYYCHYYHYKVICLIIS